MTTLFVSLVVGFVGVTVLKHHLRFADSAAVAYIVPIGASLTGVFVFLLVIYTWLPNTEVSWREALPGAVVGAVVLEATFAALAGSSASPTSTSRSGRSADPRSSCSGCT